MKGIIMTNFYLQQDFIAKTLCVNKDKPKMHCNGKCYLKKQLKKEEKKDKGIHKTEKEVTNILSVLPIYEFSEFTLIETISNKHFSYKMNYYNSYLKSVFRPPCC